MAGVYISYSRHDIRFVERLYAALRHADVPVWIDFEGISPSADWQAEIQSAMDTADAVICVLSPQSLRSEWTQSELNYARDRGKPIIPLVLGDIAPEDAPDALRSLNWIVFTEPDDFDGAFQRLMGALSEVTPLARAGARARRGSISAGFPLRRRVLFWLMVMILVTVIAATGAITYPTTAAPGQLLRRFTLPSWWLTAASLALNVILLGVLLVGWLRRRMRPEPEAQAALDSGIVFISYSRSDSDFVDKLEGDLLGERFKTWVDRRKLEGGQVWDAEIESAIQRCQLVLVILSPDALQSRWVRQEYGYAMKRNKMVIPVMFHPCRSVPRKLARLQQLDFRAGLNFEAKYRFAFGQLVAALDAIPLRRLAVAA